MGIIAWRLFWLTPIVYTPNILPPAVKDVLLASPLYKLVSSYHDVLVYGSLPDTAYVCQVGAIALLLAGFAVVLYGRASSDISDAL